MKATLNATFLISLSVLFYGSIFTACSNLDRERKITHRVECSDGKVVELKWVNDKEHTIVKGVQ